MFMDELNGADARNWNMSHSPQGVAARMYDMGIPNIQEHWPRTRQERFVKLADQDEFEPLPPRILVLNHVPLNEEGAKLLASRQPANA